MIYVIKYFHKVFNILILKKINTEYQFLEIYILSALSNIQIYVKKFNFNITIRYLLIYADQLLAVDKWGGPQGLNETTIAFIMFAISQ